MTGTTSITERGQFYAAQFALEEFNQGMTNERDKIEFVVRDIKSDPDETHIQAEQLAKSGIKVFIGTYTSACRQAILPILEKYNCLLVYPTLYEGEESHPNVIYIGEVPNQQVYPLLKYIKKHFGSNIYLIGTDYIYPQTTNSNAKNYWGLLNGTVLGEMYVPFGHSNFNEIYEDIRSKKVDAILSTLVGTSLVHFYRSFKELGFDIEALPIFSPITKETEIQEIGKSYAMGHYSSGSYFQSLDLPENNAFLESFKKRFGSNIVISSVMFNTYLGATLLLRTIHAIKSDDYLTILEELKGESFNTLCGLVKIEKTNNHLSRPIRIGKINTEGQFSVVWDSKEPIFADPFLKKKYSSINSSSWKNFITDSQYEHHGILLIDNFNEVIYTNHKTNESLHIFEGHKQKVNDINIWNEQFIFEEKKMKNLPQDYRLIIFKSREQTKSKNIEETMIFDRIKTRSPVYREELKVAQVAAQSLANILLLGETGSGKEVLAHAIHNQSNRKNGPFIAVNTGAIPKELIGSELFGFVEGAFTGAKKGGGMGKFEQSNQGTLFLDEIGEMPLDLQVSLLRVLETRTVTRLGDNKERKIDVRIIAATHRNLKEEIAFQGSFRSDLYYRLNVISIQIPPLRECIADIDLLVNDFISQLRADYQLGPYTISKNALKALKFHSWPGNIRELRNYIERAFLLSIRDKDHIIRSKHLPKEIKSRNSLITPFSSYSLHEAEKQAIYKTLKVSTNISQASLLLGISRSTLYRKMKDHNINQKNFFN